jgi:hypothetical protein
MWQNFNMKQAMQKKHKKKPVGMETLNKCANDCFFGQLHKCSLHPKNMRLCEVKTIFEGNLVLLYKIYTVSNDVLQQNLAIFFSFSKKLKGKKIIQLYIHSDKS